MSELERTAEDLELEDLREQVEALERSLRGWYGSRESDSMAVQRVRANNYYEDGEALRQLINKLTLRKIKAEDQHQIVLTVGQNPVRLLEGRFSALELLPEARLVLEYHKIRSAEYFSEDSGRSPAEFYKPGDLFVGDDIAFLSLDKLAKCLFDEGKLGLDDASQQRLSM